MRIQILPNWCKKLGLTLFVIAFIVNGGFNFLNNISSIKNRMALPGIDANSLGQLPIQI